MAGKFLHVMAVLFNQSHGAAVTTNSQSVYTWKLHSVNDRTARERNKMAFSLDLKRVLISDSVDSCCKTILEANGIAVDLKTKLTKEELLAEIPVRERRSTIAPITFALLIDISVIFTGLIFFFSEL